MRFRVGVIAVLLIGCLAGLTASAEGPLIYEYRLKGEPSESGNYTILSLTMLQGSAKAVLLWAEPSHTLIGAYLDNTAGEPSEQSWYKGLLPAKATQMHAALTAGLQGNLTRGLRAAHGDDHFLVQTLYETGGKVTTSELQIYTGNVHKFHFGTERAQPTAHGEIQADSPPGESVTCIFGDGGTCGTAKGTWSTQHAQPSRVASRHDRGAPGLGIVHGW